MQHPSAEQHQVYNLKPYLLNPFHCVLSCLRKVNPPKRSFNFTKSCGHASLKDSRTRWDANTQPADLIKHLQVLSRNCPAKVQCISKSPTLPHPQNNAQSDQLQLSAYANDTPASHSLFNVLSCHACSNTLRTLLSRPATHHMHRAIS